MQFSSLDLAADLQRALDACGYTTMTPVQQQAIAPARRGKDLQVTAQTGTGKTAAFATPLLQRLSDAAQPTVERRPKALILTPTRELAEQIANAISAYAQFLPLSVTAIYGGVKMGGQASKLQVGVDIVVSTPGRLIEHMALGNVILSDVSFVVLDEADRMLDMGFAEDVQRLGELCNADRQTLLFSATSGGAALREVVGKVLKEPEHLQLNRVSQLNEGTRQQIITADHNHHKERLVEWLLKNETYDKAIIFTNTRVQADRLYGKLVAHDFKTFVLHGEKDQKDRKLAIDRLKQGAVKILVATDVAARGLDVDGLDLVINFDMPRSGDEYVHRIGRTGRAGAEGLAISLICHNDWALMSSIERYLKQRFERRNIKDLKGIYQGPKNLKASGKAVGPKKKKVDPKTGKKLAKKPVAKAPSKRNTINRPKPDAPVLVSQDGLAPLKRRTPAAE